LPSSTRYEIPGGVTETSTERRVIFSPEIPGPRIDEARSEWEVFLELARRVRPEWANKLAFAGTEAIREEIARTIPFYDGMQNLKKKGDSFQYGGPMLCAGQKFSTADGKAHFKAVSLPQVSLPAGAFRVVRRRGKQFNSMVHEDIDATTHASCPGAIETDSRHCRHRSGCRYNSKTLTLKLCDFGTFEEARCHHHSRPLGDTGANVVFGSTEFECSRRWFMRFCRGKRIDRISRGEAPLRPRLSRNRKVWIRLNITRRTAF
jgi:hypothetical protein